MGHSRQRGMVLVTSLLLLVVMTGLVVSSINTGTANLRIADNARAKAQARATVQLAVNRFLSREVHFDPPQGATYTIGPHTVTITKPECVALKPADGYSAVKDITPDDVTWEFTATIDHAEGASASVEQGVEIRMPSGSCT